MTATLPSDQSGEHEVIFGRPCVVVEEQYPVRAWVADMFEQFESARVTYLKGPIETGVERGEKGDEGVVATQKPRSN